MRNLPIFTLLEDIGNGVILMLRAFMYLPSIFRGLQFKRCLEQAFVMGNKTLPIVAILSFSIGAVLALQVGFSFEGFDFKQYIGSIVGTAMVRELGPLITAIIVTGRIGSAITAELASMKVYQEVDALTTMNILPEKILVLPRLLAILLVMPVLTVASITIGWLGGAIVSKHVGFINLDMDLYFRALMQFVNTDSLIDGILKGQIFGIVVINICCTVGLTTSGGPREIGTAVTKGVVSSIITILILNYFVTNLLLAF